MMMISKRKNEPAHYLFKIESFSLLSEAKISVIESDVFEASGHKRRLDLYPNGNKKNDDDDGDDDDEHNISLYLVMCDTESLAKGWEVCADVNFYVFDHKNLNYATFQGVDGNRIRFNEKKIKWGFDKLISLESFEQSKNGYLWNDSCVFGAEVFNVPAFTQKDRCLSLIKPPATMNTYTWTIDNFSDVTDEFLYSEVFKVGKVKWNLKIYPKGFGLREGTHLSIVLRVIDAASLPAGWRLYTKCKLRVKNQCGCAHVHKEIDRWFYDGVSGCGFPKFMRLSKLYNPANGFLLNNSRIVEAEFSLVGTFSNFI